MKWFLSLFIAFFSLHALGFSYELESASLLNPSITERYELAQIFAGKGYRGVSDVSLSKLGFPFDGVYTSSDWKQSLMLKAGLKVPASVEGRIIEDASLGMLIFHFKFNGTPYLLAAQNISKAEFANIVRPWLSTSRSSVLFSLAIPKAEAFDCSFAQSKFDDFVNTKEFIESRETLQTIGKCAVDAFDGAKQSAGRTVEFFEKLTMDPRALWGEMKESYAELKDFVFNINTEMKSALDSFSAMDPAERSQLVCNMTGELIMGALQGLVVAGGLAKLLPSLLLKLKAATATLAKLANLEKMGIKLPNKSLLAKEALSCAR